MVRPPEYDKEREGLVKTLTQTGVASDEVESFIYMLHLAFNTMRKGYVKQCTIFIMLHILVSSKCTLAFARFLLATSLSFKPRPRPDDPKIWAYRDEPWVTEVDTRIPADENAGLGKIIKGIPDERGVMTPDRIQQPPLPHWKRVNLLYVVHDVMMVAQRRALANAHHDAASIQVQQNVELLKRWAPLYATLAAYSDNEWNTKSFSTLHLLFSIWRDQKLVSDLRMIPIECDIREADDAAMEWDALVQKVTAQEQSTSQIVTREQAAAALEAAFDAALKLPRRHGVAGDSTAPWHELPAANGLFMKRTRGYPLMAAAMPVGGYELDTKERVPEPELKADVKNLHKEMLGFYDKFTNPADVQDIDALGNVIFKDPERLTRNYYGFSLDGIGKMKEMSKYFQENATGYADVPGRAPDNGVSAAVNRAKSLAAGRGRGGHGRGHGYGRGGGRPPPPPPPPPLPPSPPPPPTHGGPGSRGFNANSDERE